MLKGKRDTGHKQQGMERCNEARDISHPHPPTPLFPATSVFLASGVSAG